VTICGCRPDSLAQLSEHRLMAACSMLRAEGGD
jgi:hypothetical protein